MKPIFIAILFVCSCSKSSAPPADSRSAPKQTVPVAETTPKENEKPKATDAPIGLPLAELQPDVLVERCERVRKFHDNSTPIKWNRVRTLTQKTDLGAGKQNLKIRTSRDDPSMEFGCEISLEDELIYSCEGKNSRFAIFDGLFFAVETDDYGLGSYVYDVVQNLDVGLPGEVRRSGKHIVFTDSENALGLRSVGAFKPRDLFSDEDPVEIGLARYVPDQAREFACFRKKTNLFKSGSLEIEASIDLGVQALPTTTISTTEPGFELVGCHGITRCLLRSDSKVGFHTVVPADLNNPKELNAYLNGERD